MKDCANEINIPNPLPDIVITTETPGALTGTVAIASASTFVTQGTPCTFEFRHVKDITNSCYAAVVGAANDLMY
jgi:hypothetical protein